MSSEWVLGFCRGAFDVSASHNKSCLWHNSVKKNWLSAGEVWLSQQHTHIRPQHWTQQPLRWDVPSVGRCKKGGRLSTNTWRCGSKLGRRWPMFWSSFEWAWICGYCKTFGASLHLFLRLCSVQSLFKPWCVRVWARRIGTLNWRSQADGAWVDLAYHLLACFHFEMEDYCKLRLVQISIDPMGASTSPRDILWFPKRLYSFGFPCRSSGTIHQKVKTTVWGMSLLGIPSVVAEIDVVALMQVYHINGRHRTWKRTSHPCWTMASQWLSRCKGFSCAIVFSNWISRDSWFKILRHFKIMSRNFGTFLCIGLQQIFTFGFLVTCKPGTQQIKWGYSTVGCHFNFFHWAQL